MKANELREMNDEQLGAELNQVRKDLFQLKFQAAVERIDAPSNLKRLRREIARIKTIQRERAIASGADSTTQDANAAESGAVATAEA